MNTNHFEAWLHKTGRKWYHLTEAEKRAAVKEYKARQK